MEKNQTEEKSAGGCQRKRYKWMRFKAALSVMAKLVYKK